MKQFYILTLILFLSCFNLIAQSTEDFETFESMTEAFTSNGQSFTINDLNTDDFDVAKYGSAFGWNGTATDFRFIDNGGGQAVTAGDGTAFSITTTDGADITVKSLYITLATATISNPTQPITLTILGRKDGAVQFTITKTSGFANTSTFTPNNGFTLIDFATEGGSDNSNTSIDEIIFTTNNDADYVGVDAFTWDAVTTVSTEDFETLESMTEVFTNNGQSFTINDLNTDDFDVAKYGSAFGWNGTATDFRFIDNGGGQAVTAGDGTAFSITTTDGADITVKRLYITLATATVSNPTQPITLTILGRKDGAVQFAITKTTGFANTSTFTPNNGFTLIDFATEGGSDNSNTNIDEVIFTTTNDSDYVGIDAFTWDAAATTLSTNNFALKTIKTVPNPSKDFITIYGVTTKASYKIYNTIGKEVKKGITSENKRIDIQNLTNGLYFLKLDNSNTVKFIKE